MMSMPAIQNMSTYPGQNFFEHVVVKTDPSVHSSDGDDDDKFVNHSVPFPWKLHEMLDAAEKESFTCVVSWLPDRQSFKVHQTESFVRGVMPTYFRQTKYKSFQRQLNMWGFERILAGPNKGGYSHVNFVRGQPALCRHMKRLKIKGNGNKRASSPSDSPSTTPTPLRVPPHRLVSSQVSDIMCQEKQRQQQQQQRPVSSTSKPQDPVGSRIAAFPQQLDDDLFDEGTLLSVLSSVLDNPLKAPENTPHEGDCVLFEGMQFFFVEQEAEKPLGTSARRMSSIELSRGIAGTGKRRLSLVGGAQGGFLAGRNGMGGSNILPQQGLQGFVGLNRATAMRACRRFSLERGGTNGYGGGYVLKQI